MPARRLHWEVLFRGIKADHAVLNYPLDIRMAIYTNSVDSLIRTLRQVHQSRSRIPNEEHHGSWHHNQIAVAVPAIPACIPPCKRAHSQPGRSIVASKGRFVTDWNPLRLRLAQRPTHSEGLVAGWHVKALEWNRRLLGEHYWAAISTGSVGHKPRAYIRGREASDYDHDRKPLNRQCCRTPPRSLISM